MQIKTERIIEAKWIKHYTETAKLNTFYAGALGIILYCGAILSGIFPYIEFNTPLVVSVLFPVPVILIMMYVQKRFGLRHEFLLFTIMCTFILSTALLPLFVDNEFWQSMLALPNVAIFVIPAILILTKVKNILAYIIYAIVVNAIIINYFAN